MTEKKLFVFDLDGTLLNSKKKVSQPTLEALEAIRQAGHEIAIATGRTYSMSEEAIKASQINHYIVCNGSAAYLNNDLFYINPLDRDEFKNLVDTALDQSHQLIYETPTQLKRHYDEVNQRVVDGMDSVKQPIPEADSDFYLNEDIVQVLLFADPKEIKSHYQGQYEKLQFVRWHDKAVDVIPANGSKWESVKRLAIELDIPEEQIVTFGDGNNDFEMISQAKTSVAMGNGKDHLKDAASFVAESNDADGIAKIIKSENLL